MTKEIDEFQPAGRLNQNQNTPEIAMTSAVAILPMQNDQDIKIDEGWNYKKSRSDTAENPHRVFRHVRGSKKRKTNQRKYG